MFSSTVFLPVIPNLLICSYTHFQRVLGLGLAGGFSTFETLAAKSFLCVSDLYSMFVTGKYTVSVYLAVLRTDPSIKPTKSVCPRTNSNNVRATSSF